MLRKSFKIPLNLLLLLVKVKRNGVFCSNKFERYFLKTNISYGEQIHCSSHKLISTKICLFSQKHKFSVVLLLPEPHRESSDSNATRITSRFASTSPAISHRIVSSVFLCQREFSLSLSLTVFKSTTDKVY